MTTILDKVEHEALSLPEPERAFLADRLLNSLGGNALSDIDAAWVAEAERRYAEHKAGKRHSLPAAEVFAEADSLTQ